MLRILALLIFCGVSLLVQGLPAQAHPGHSTQVTSESRVGHAELRNSQAQENDCSSMHGRCCKSMCAACYLPPPPQQQEFMVIRLKSSTLLPLRDGLAQLVVLGRDPPIPRPYDL